MSFPRLRPRCNVQRSTSIRRPLFKKQVRFKRSTEYKIFRSLYRRKFERKLINNILNRALRRRLTVHNFHSRLKLRLFLLRRK